MAAPKPFMSDYELKTVGKSPVAGPIPMMNWGNPSAPVAGPVVGLDTPSFNPGLVPNAGSSIGASTPELGGGWTSKAGLALSAVSAGVGVANAIDGIKMNKFMRGYYGDQMKLQRADFGNAAKSTNTELAARQERILGAQGLTTGSEENKAATADYMKQWGVKEKY